MRTSKLLLSLGASASLGLGLLAPAAATPFDGNCDLSGVGSSADPFLLGSEADLIDMDSCSVNSGTIHFELSNDIFISAGFGNYYRDAYFDDSGTDVTLEGGSHGIYGLRFGDPLALEVGFFGDVEDLTVRNLTLQTGAIVGGNETGVLVGEASNLVVQNLTIINDSLSCFDECGLLAGRVNGSANVDQVTVVTNSFSVGSRSGLLIGNLNADPGVDSNFTNINATGAYKYTWGSGSFGGLIGEVIGGRSTSFSDIYVMAQARDFNNDTGPYAAGGLIGEYSTNDVPTADSELNINGVFAEFEIESATMFGGMVGQITHFDDDNEDRALTIELTNVMARGVVTYAMDAQGVGGGLIGQISADADTSLIIDQALVSVVHDDIDANSNDVNVVSIVEVDDNDVPGPPLVSAVFTDVVLNSDDWDDSVNNVATTSANTGDITDLTTVELNVAGNLPFTAAAHPGELGTDAWEICDTSGGPFPTFTPNACTQPAITLLGNQISAELNQSAGSITDQELNGFGESLFYSVEPSLPRGLYLNPITGTIAGTPIELRAAGTYAIYKYNALTNPLKSTDEDVSWPETTLRVTTTAVSFFVAEALMPTLLSQQQSQAQAAVPPAIRAYAGPILVQFSERNLVEGKPATVSVRGERLDLITDISIDGRPISFTTLSDSGIEMAVPALSPGQKTIVVRSTWGVLNHEGALVVSQTSNPLTQEGGATAGVVNAGSFKGFVAIYAKGYEGKRLSAKVGKDWMVVPVLASNFVRVTDFTGAGVEISVRIFIDRVQVGTFPLVTK